MQADHALPSCPLWWRKQRSGGGEYATWMMLCCRRRFSLFWWQNGYCTEGTVGETRGRKARLCRTGQSGVKKRKTPAGKPTEQQDIHNLASLLPIRWWLADAWLPVGSVFWGNGSVWRRWPERAINKPHRATRRTTLGLVGRRAAFSCPRADFILPG